MRLLAVDECRGLAVCRQVIVQILEFLVLLLKGLRLRPQLVQLELNERVYTVQNEGEFNLFK